MVGKGVGAPKESPPQAASARAETASSKKNALYFIINSIKTAQAA